MCYFLIHMYLVDYLQAFTVKFADQGYEVVQDMELLCYNDFSSGLGFF